MCSSTLPVLVLVVYWLQFEEMRYDAVVFHMCIVIPLFFRQHFDATGILHVGTVIP